MALRKKIKLIVVTSLILSVIACSLSSETRDASIKIPVFDPQKLNAEILRYKSWTLVNPRPEKMAPEVEAACADVRKSKILGNPHRDKYIRVYVNETGRNAMFQEFDPKFPTGSVIVKEKLPDENSEVPEFYTIMVKRENGFDPVNGDWQYLTMDKSRSKIEESRIADNQLSCQSCHMSYKDRSDYVSREYLRFGEHKY
jgi:hypothetical protein